MEEVAEGFKRVIEWRAFLVALADCQFEFFLSKSTLEDIVQARVGKKYLHTPQMKS